MAECNVQELVNSAQCFACLTPNQMLLVEVQLLCDILAGTLVRGAVECGTVDPSGTPTSNCTLYYRSDNGALWFWNGTVWVQLIAP